MDASVLSILFVAVSSFAFGLGILIAEVLRVSLIGAGVGAIIGAFLLTLLAILAMKTDKDFPEDDPLDPYRDSD